MKSLIVIIANPAAKKASLKKIEYASAFFKRKGFNTEVMLTEKNGHATQLAKEAILKKPYLIIAAGGDGTINEVVNGIALSDIPLSILPLGTTNVLAKELAIPEDINAALESAVSKTPKTISLGQIELINDSSGVSRYFCLMTGVGFDGKTVYDMNKTIKKVSGKSAYILSGLKNLFSYFPTELFFNIDGKEYSGYAAIIGKASRYGGNFRATPDANLAEPALYTCIFKGRNRTDLLRYVFGIIRGNHLKHKDIVYLKSANIEIQGAAHIQVDGDYLGITPAKISVKKDAIKLIC